MAPKPWLKERPPWWALAIFGCLLVVVVALMVWGIFYDGEIP